MCQVWAKTKMSEGCKELLKEVVAVHPPGSCMSAECSFSVCTVKATDLTQRHSKHWKDNESFLILIFLSLRLKNWTSRCWTDRKLLNGRNVDILILFVLFCAALYALVINENLLSLLVPAPCFHGLYITLSNHSPTLWLSLCVCACACRFVCVCVCSIVFILSAHLAVFICVSFISCSSIDCPPIALLGSDWTLFSTGLVSPLFPAAAERQRFNIFLWAAANFTLNFPPHFVLY